MATAKLGQSLSHPQMQLHESVLTEQGRRVWEMLLASEHLGKEAPGLFRRGLVTKQEQSRKPSAFQS